jgi:hypothetical protein
MMAVVLSTLAGIHAAFGCVAGQRRQEFSDSVQGVPAVKEPFREFVELLPGMEEFEILRPEEVTVVESVSQADRDTVQQTMTLFVARLGILRKCCQAKAG